MSFDLKDFNAYLAEEVNKRISAKLESLKNFASENEEPLYLSDDIMDLLGLKSIWSKLSNLVENQEKFTRSISINGNMRNRTVVNKKAVSKIISTMRKPPHKFICEYFSNQFNDESNKQSHEVQVNNIYIKRLQHIFQSQDVKIFYKIHTIQLDVFLPKSGIIILFSKKDKIFDETSTPLYAAAQQEILKMHTNLKTIRWIQFTSFDSNNSTQFDELLKDIISLM
jgi:hypothetical protein